MCWFTCGRREKDVGGKKRGEKKRKWGWGSNGEEEGVPGRDRCVVLCGAGNEVWYSGENHHHTTHHNTFNTQHRQQTQIQTIQIKKTAEINRRVSFLPAYCKYQKPVPQQVSRDHLLRTGTLRVYASSLSTTITEYPKCRSAYPAA